MLDCSAFLFSEYSLPPAPSATVALASPFLVTASTAAHSSGLMKSCTTCILTLSVSNRTSTSLCLSFTPSAALTYPHASLETGEVVFKDGSSHVYSSSMLAIEVLISFSRASLAFSRDTSEDTLEWTHSSTEGGEPAATPEKQDATMASAALELRDESSIREAFISPSSPSSVISTTWFCDSETTNLASLQSLSSPPSSTFLLLAGEETTHGPSTSTSANSWPT
mmetsp:Transcript_7728/g.15425  ORF Transcript_7728/g.15425 Transcript_7728/m.15425 type:complete len:224 (+) Transcript_7728:437-1108(+)